MQSVFIGMKQVVLFCLFITFTGSLWGMEVEPLYEVELPTKNETKNFDQAKLIEQAFQTVLVRVCGSDKILSVPAAIQALTETDRYINQFSYHQRPAGEHYIKVIFNENRVNQLFKNMQQFIWGKSRPLTLVWLVVEKNQMPYWVGGDYESTLLRATEKVLNDRAIPFVFPLLDLTDTSLVSEQMVVNETLEPLEQAAKRYNPDVILLGRLSQKPGGWEGHWTLVKEGTKTSWNNTETEVNALLNTSAENLTAMLIGRNIEITKSDEDQKIQSRFILSVSGILSGEQYTRVLGYLRRLPGVNGVEVIEVMPEKTTFNIETVMSKEEIAKLIAEGRMLIENSPAELQENGNLSFKVAEAGA